MPQKQDRLFAPEKIAWILDGGLESMDAGELDLLLVMAETKIQDGYKPSPEELRALDRLRALSGEGARDIKRKVRSMVKGRSKAGSASLSLPPMFNRLLKRLGRESKE